MGKDNQPKHRQKERDLRRRAAIRQPYQRLLIVCEGEKTEPQYLDEIRQELRLATAHVQVRPSGFGTEPLQVVEYAEHLFRHGDRAGGIEANSSIVSSPSSTAMNIGPTMQHLPRRQS